MNDKNYMGNKKSVYVTLGASSHTDKPREPNDFYATEPKAVTKLFDYFRTHPNAFPAMSQHPVVWECACGNGILAEELLRQGCAVVCTDIVNRGYNAQIRDFLDAPLIDENITAIITNPPYKYATEFVLHALDILPVGGLCIMLMRIQFLECRKRYEKIFKCYKPTLVLQFVDRILCAKNAQFDEMRAAGGSAVAFAWFIWRKGHTPPNTIVDWLV